MTHELQIKRYNAYYLGWCLAFGEHEANIDKDRDLYWLAGEDRIGMAVVPKLQRMLNLALLGHHDEIPQLELDNNSVKAQGKTIYQLTDEVDRDGVAQLKEFLNYRDQLHLFITNHFCYPPGTRIITFAREKPTILLYKEMQPLKILIS